MKLAYLQVCLSDWTRNCFRTLRESNSPFRVWYPAKGLLTGGTVDFYYLEMTKLFYCKLLSGLCTLGKFFSKKIFK